MYINNYKKIERRWRRDSLVNSLEIWAYRAILASLIVCMGIIALQTNIGKASESVASHNEKITEQPAQGVEETIFLMCDESVKNKKLKCL